MAGDQGREGGSLEFVDSGNLTINVVGGSGPTRLQDSVQVDHNLGYAPALLLYMETSTGIFSPISSGVWQAVVGVGADIQTFTINVDRKTLYITMTHDLPASVTQPPISYNFKYYLLNPATK